MDGKENAIENPGIVFLFWLWRERAMDESNHGEIPWK
jgi:hypothetical protein